MSNNKYHDLILAVITEKGELGVNEIARAIEVPLSTVQKYLERQTYFKKTERRKWDLPHNVNADIKSDTMSLMVNSVENALLLVSAQFADLQESVQNALIPVNTLKRGISTLRAPVAPKAPDIDKRLIELSNTANSVYEIIKNKKDNIPSDHVDTLLNLDYIGLVLTLGTNEALKLIGEDVYQVLSGKYPFIPEETINILLKYQKGE